MLRHAYPALQRRPPRQTRQARAPPTRPLLEAPRGVVRQHHAAPRRPCLDALLQVPFQLVQIPVHHLAVPFDRRRVARHPPHQQGGVEIDLLGLAQRPLGDAVDRTEDNVEPPLAAPGRRRAGTAHPERATVAVQRGVICETHKRGDEGLAVPAPWREVGDH